MTKPCLSILQAIHSCEENPSPSLGNHKKSKETNWNSSSRNTSESIGISRPNRRIVIFYFIYLKNRHFAYYLSAYYTVDKSDRNPYVCTTSSATEFLNLLTNTDLLSWRNFTRSYYAWRACFGGIRRATMPTKARGIDIVYIAAYRRPLFASKVNVGD